MSYLKGYIGEIHSVDEVNYTARAKIFELDNSITEDLQITTSMASKKTICQLPAIGSPCLIIMFDDDTERGFILTSFFTERNKVPEGCKKDNYILNLGNVSLTLDNEANLISLDSKDTISLKAKNIKFESESLEFSSSNISIKSTNIDITGTIKSKDIITAKDFIKG